ncbi:transposase [Microcoleus sp. FACHB-53]|nr:transposase [Microcoleus sp. FACHB-53]
MKKNYADCLTLLEQIRWGGIPQCPYCQSTNSTAIRKECRYHCNTCFNSYSVTVGTLFHQTRVDLRKWFLAIHLFLTSSGDISVRKLAREIKVNKNTASYMLSRIRQAIVEEEELIQKLIKLNINGID